MEWYEQQNKWFDCFDILELDETATTEDIKCAYHRLVKIYHPDNGKIGNIEKFRKVKIAYETLIDQKKREDYQAFSKTYRKAQDQSGEKSKQEENLNFTDIVKIYKEKEKQIKVHLNIMIGKVEKREQQFSSVYKEFCNALKNRNLSVSEFEIRRQKLRSAELSSINSIFEIRQIIDHDLKYLDLDCEKKKLKKILSKFQKTEGILTSNYNQSIIKLNLSQIKFKKRYIAFIPVSIILAGLYLLNTSDKEKALNSREGFVIAESDAELESTEIEETNGDIESLSKQNKKPEGENLTDCILFQEISENILYDKVSEPYREGSFEVIEATKDGVHYLLDATDYHVILTNYVSSGYWEGNKVLLGIDGYDYTLDTSDLRTVLEVKPTHYSKENKPFYLEGYGQVIESTVCGMKFILDTQTRYPLVKNLRDCVPLYYDDELEGNVSCFTAENLKFLVPSNDLTKVLKIEKK